LFTQLVLPELHQRRAITTTTTTTIISKLGESPKVNYWDTVVVKLSQASLSWK